MFHLHWADFEQICLLHSAVFSGRQSDEVLVEDVVS